MTRRSSRYLFALIALMFLLPVIMPLLFSQLPPSLVPAVPITMAVLGIVAGVYLLVRLQAGVHRDRDRG